MTPHPNCRIKSVTYKASGLTVHILPTAVQRTRASILAETRHIIDQMHHSGLPAVGFALVIWDTEGGSSAALRAYPGSNIPSIAMPDFIRNRLLAEKVLEWSRT